MLRTLGHPKAVAILQRSLDEGRLSHAYLLVGPRHVGKMTLAMDLAQMVNCAAPERPCGQCDQCKRISTALHADVRVVSVEGQPGADGRGRVTIGIDQVREVQREAGLKPYEGRSRVFIFDGAEHLSEEAANSLLKILEEPPEQVVLILLAPEAAALPPTVVSRCQRLELRPVPLSAVAEVLAAREAGDHRKIEEIARLSGGKLGWAIRAATDPQLLAHRAERMAEIEEVARGTLEKRFAYASNLAYTFMQDRESAREELTLWLEWWRDALVLKEGAAESVVNVSRMSSLRLAAGALSSAQIAGAIKAVLETSSYLERNVNPRLALEDMMLRLPRR